MKTKLNGKYLISHKIEHVPYLYDLIYSKEYYKIGKNKIIFDVGAHIGSFSLKYSKNNCVYSFEPNSENYRFLVENIKLNKLNNNIYPNNIALGYKKGNRKLGLSGGSGGHSFHLKNKKFEEVQTISLDEFVSDNHLNHVDIVKVDAEGDELNILEGAGECIKKMRPLLIIELHPWYTSSKKIIKKLKNLNYKVDYLDGLKLYASKIDDFRKG